MAELPPRIFNPQHSLDRAGDGRSLAAFEAGQPVFRQGDPATAVYYLQRGRVKISVVSGTDKEVVVALHNPKEFFGEGALGNQSHRISSAVCLSASIICRIEKATVAQLIREEPAFARLFVAHLLNRAIRTEADLIDQLFNCSEKRLARMLLLLANFGKSTDDGAVIVNISQETLAQMIGTTRARVSYFMNRFMTLGYVSYNGRIKVRSALLRRFLDDQPQDEPPPEMHPRPVVDDQSCTVIKFRPS